MKKETLNEQVAEADGIQAEKKSLSVNEDGKVGGMLKEARMKKGLKVADIAKELCIRASYLEAIESSNYDEIPEHPYGVGFIRTYAEFLGLNSARIVQLFKEETDASSRSEDVYVLEPQAEATVPSKKYILISFGAILLLYVAWFAYKENLENEMAPVADDQKSIVVETGDSNDFPLQVEDFATIDETAPAATDEVVVIDTTAAAPVEVPSGQITVNEGNFVEPVAEAPAVQPVTEKTPSAEPAAPVVDEPVAEETPKVNVKPGSRVLVKVNKETWVEVKDQNKLWISKVLQPGAAYSVPAGSGKILSVGHADGVEVLIDGKVTPVVTAAKKTGIALDKFLEANH